MVKDTFVRGHRELFHLLFFVTNSCDEYALGCSTKEILSFVFCKARKQKVGDGSHDLEHATSVRIVASI